MHINYIYKKLFMKRTFTILLTAFLFFSLNSCSNDEKEDAIIPEGLIVTANGKTKTYKTEVTEHVFEKGTSNEYADLIIAGKLENSDERIFIALHRGKTGNNAIYQVLYINDKNEEHIYFNVTGEGETNYNFKSNTTVNNNEKKLEGRFSGTLSTNGKGTSTDLKGTFKIQY